MTQRLEIPVQSCSDGTAIVVICPYFACEGIFQAGTTYLPFVQNSSNTQLPYFTAPYNSQPGPFNTQVNNFINFTVSSLVVDYIHTESMLNTKGRVEVSIFG